MLIKTIVPMAEEQGIMPWPLLYLDQTVSLFHFNSEVAQTLVRYARVLTMWYGRAVEHMSQGKTNGINFVGITYKEVSGICHSALLVPQLLQEHELHKYQYFHICFSNVILCPLQNIGYSSCLFKAYFKCTIVQH